MDYAMNNIELAGLIAHLVRDGLLTQDVGINAAHAAKQLNMPQVHYLVRHHLLTSDAIFTYCQKQFSLPVFSLENYDRSLLQKNILNPALIHRYRVLPLRVEQSMLHLGITDPTDQAALAAAAFDS